MPSDARLRITRRRHKADHHAGRSHENGTAKFARLEMSYVWPILLGMYTGHGFAGDPAGRWTLFKSESFWQDEGTPALDIETGLPVQPEDCDASYWRSHGYGGTGKIVCLECWSGQVPGIESGTEVPLVFRESEERRAHFAHPPGMAHESVGEPGGTVWHLRAKRLLREWALDQADVSSVDVEWVTTDRLRRSDVRVLDQRGTTVALEAQQRLLTPSEWRARRSSYGSSGIRDYWFWPINIRKPDTTPDGLTSFAIDVEGRRFGLIVSLRSLRNSAAAVTFEWPPLVFKPLAALWAPIHDWRLLEGHLVTPQHLIDTWQLDERSEPSQPRIVPSKLHEPSRTRLERFAAPVNVGGAGLPRFTGRPPTPTKNMELRCSECRLPLDPILTTAGRHIGC